MLLNLQDPCHKGLDSDRLRVFHKHNVRKDATLDSRISCSDCSSGACKTAIDIFAVPTTTGSSILDSGAFKSCPNIKTVIVGSTVTTIGEEAFSDSINIWKVSISSSVKVPPTNTCISIS